MNRFVYVGVALTGLLLFTFGRPLACSIAPNASICVKSKSVDGIVLNYQRTNPEASFDITIERAKPPLDEVPLPSDVTVVSPFYAISSKQRVIFPERPGSFELSLPIPDDVNPKRSGVILLSPFDGFHGATTTEDGYTRHPRAWFVGHTTVLVDLEEGTATLPLTALYSEKMYFALVTADWLSPVVVE